MSTLSGDARAVAEFAVNTVSVDRGFLLFVFQPEGGITRQECISDMDPEFVKDFLRQLVSTFVKHQN